MTRYDFIIRGIIVFCLLFINLFPLIGLPNLGESGAPDGNGITNAHWFISSTNDLTKKNDTYWTKDITINSSGKMYWENITAMIDGDIVVNSNSFFNLTDCTLNLSGNFSILGDVNFDNVLLLMNSSSDGEFGINVAKSGTFNVLNNSNITAYNKTAPIDIFSSESGPEAWGLHYNFTVHGKLVIDWSYVSYTYGNTNYYGGIHLYSDSDASITNSSIYENEIAAIYIEGHSEGSIEHLIRNNHIYNSSSFGIYLYDYANAMIYNNIIETFLTNYGMGIVCDDHCAPKIYMNTIRNNSVDGIFLVDYSNATIWNNTIYNNQRVGIFLNGRVISVTPNPPSVDATICNPVIEENRIIDNFEFGIYDRCCHAQIRNNTISNTRNQSGIYVVSYQVFSVYVVHFSCEGNITNNTIKNNNNYGLYMISTWQQPWIITMNVKNNSITNNNWSGLAVIGGLDSNSVQRSPLPDIGFNNISNNNDYGILARFALSYNIWENEIGMNNLSGIFLRNSSRPEIFENEIHNNYEHGIDSRGGSRPDVNTNNISFNNHSGIYGQGSNNNFRIRYNNIFNNSWNGIECNNTQCRIQGNDVHNNRQNGIKLGGGSPTINANNVISYNHWNGLSCLNNAQPTIVNNVFNFNLMNGLHLDNSAPVKGGTQNMINNNSMNGVHCENGAGGEIYAYIGMNYEAGVYTTGTGTDTLFIDSNISGNGANGVNATSNSAPEFTNSTIGDDNSGYAFWCSGSADPVAVNTTFNSSSTYFDDSASMLTRKWFVHVRVVSDADSSPIGKAIVWINSTTQTSANPLIHGVSDMQGRLYWLKVTDYTEKQSGKTQYSPVDVSGEAFNYRTTHVSPNPTIDRSQTIILRLLPNNPPNMVTNIKPFITHSIRPNITWDPATDPDAHNVGYKVWIGTVANTSNIFAHDSPLITNNYFKLPVDLEHNTVTGNRSYELTIVSNDGHGGENFAFQTMYLINHKPSKPGISLNVPENPTVLLKSVTCTITNLSIDPDGDEIEYTFKWKKNGKEQTALTNVDPDENEDTISIFGDDIEFVKGDTWEVFVYANDGIGFTNVVRETAKFTIGNAGPMVSQTIEDITMDEDQKKIGAIDLSKAFTDIDETGSLSYTIVVDNVNLTVKENKDTNKLDIIPATNWNGAAEVSVTCRDAEGLTANQLFKVVVQPVNDKPEFLTIGSLPWRPGITISFTEDDSATEDRWFNFTVTGSDADITNGEDDELSFMINKPDKVLLTHSKDDPLSATLSFYPTNDDVGTFSFSISIKDKDSPNYLHETEIEIHVKNVNDAPEIISIKKYSSDNVYEFPQTGILDLRDYIKLKQDDTLTLLVAASDQDLMHLEDSLTFHASALDFINIDMDTDTSDTAKVIIKPKWNNIGLLKFNISVKDIKLLTDSVQVILNVDNVNDKPLAIIDQPAVADNIYYQDAQIDLVGDVEDLDLELGDEITYTWSSDRDGVLGQGRSIVVSNLSIGKHYITLKVEDSAGDFNSVSTSIIIREVEVPPEEEPEEEEESDLTFIMLMIVMVVIIVVMLLILFLVLRKKKKDGLDPTKEEEKKPFQYQQQPGEEPTPGPDQVPTQLQGTGTPGVIPTPTQYVPPSQNIPQTQTQTPPQQPTIPFVPPQVTTCPKCNNVMTFSPDGSPFCIACGYTPEK